MAVIRKPLSTKKNSSGIQEPWSAVAPAWYATTGTINSARTPVSAGRLPSENGVVRADGVDPSASVSWISPSESLDAVVLAPASRSSLIGDIMSYVERERMLTDRRPTDVPPVGPGVDRLGEETEPDGDATDAGRCSSDGSAHFGAGRREAPAWAARAGERLRSAHVRGRNPMTTGRLWIVCP